jgi:hypothetical protein
MDTPVRYPAQSADFLAKVAEDLEAIAEEIEMLAAVISGRAVRSEQEGAD